MLEPLNLALRGLAVGFVLALALGSVHLPGRARRALWPLLACLAGYLIRGEPLVTHASVALLLPLTAAALLFPIAFWWLVHNAFDDRTDVPGLVWAAAVLLLGTGLLPPPAADSALAAYLPQAAQKAIGGAFVVAALWRLWRGRVDDLVPRRRVWRNVLLAYIGAHGLTVLAVELLLLGRGPVAWLDTLNVGVIALALALALTLLLGVRGTAEEALFGRAGEQPPAASPGVPAPAGEAAVGRAPPLQAVDAEAASIERLQRLMTADRVYRDPDLDVRTLAERCGLPEYRLRELIHRRLGFRNFAAFVNEHRLREVEQRLVDPACGRLPILTLALEAGFGSVGPFNRAFRERHGMTPSAYRSGRSGAEPGLSLRD